MESTGASDIDIEANRANIAYARSTKLIKSWLPPPPAAQQRNSNEPDADSQDENDSDFKSMPEKSGVGSKIAFDEELGIGSLRRKGTSNDKLLEQLLGRKAAESKKRSLDSSARESMGKKSVGSKAIVSRPKQRRDSEDDDEGGRSAAFRSKKTKILQRDPNEITQASAERNEDGDEADTATRSTSRENSGAMLHRKIDSDDEEKPAKRRKNTYLDELLTSRAKKSKKKKAK